MTRIKWLDASRGIAVLLLIVMHYVGALETREIISRDMLDVFYGILRLATPFFMFTFGVAFFITSSRKISDTSLLNYYKNNVLKRLFYIFLGREIIVLILVFRYPETSEHLVSILMFQEFAKGGEILIFYFFAFLVAPINVVFLKSVKPSVYILFWSFIYGLSYYIGSHYIDHESNNALRFLFYDIYAFFPFMSLVALAMLIAHYFQKSDDKLRFLYNGLQVSILMIALGFAYVGFLTEFPWRDLANAKFKQPPHLAYMIFYLGEVFFIVSLVALVFSKLPGLITELLSVIGRNTLVCYVLHYAFYFSVPIGAYFGGGAVKEVTALILIGVLSFIAIKKWDGIKQRSKKQNVPLVNST